MGSRISDSVQRSTDAGSLTIASIWIVKRPVKGRCPSGLCGSETLKPMIRTEMGQINRIFGETSSSGSDIGSSQSLEGSEQNLFDSSWIPNSRIPRNGEKGTDAWESLPDYYDLGFQNNGENLSENKLLYPRASV